MKNHEQPGPPNPKRDLNTAPKGRMGPDLASDFRDPDESIIHEMDQSPEENERFKNALAYLRQMRGQIKALEKRETSRIESTQTGKTPGTRIPSSPDRYPDCIGRFEIVKVLGGGGFAKVFLANDPILNRLVALKVPKRNVLTSEEAKFRFEREAQTAALLTHPNIVPIYETGSVDDTSFIASGYCSGKTLRDWFLLHDKKIDQRVAAQIVSKLAEAADYAHRRGIIHRDLKPDNILFESEVDENSDDHEIANSLRITDFGLAKSIQSDDLSLTTDGAIIGTPSYMSPEQARGDKSIGRSSDIYSLGVMLYELLSGGPPHLGENHISTLRAVENDIPVELSKHRRSIPRDLDAICLKAISKRPADRYQTAQLLSADLENWLSGQPISARNIGPLGKVSRWVSRKPLLALALGAAVLSLAVGLATTTWQWQKSLANLELAKSERQRTERHLEQVESGLDDLLVSVALHLDENPRLRPFRDEVLNNVLKIQMKLIEEEKDHPLVRTKTAQAHFRVAEIQRMLGNNRVSSVHTTRALKLLDAEEISTIVQRRQQRMAKGQADDEEDLLILQILLETGQNHFQVREHAKAIPTLQTALEFSETFDSAWSRQEIAVAKLSVYRMLGASYEIGLDFQKAEETYLAAAELQNHKYSGSHPGDWKFENASIRNSHGILLKRIGRADEGLKLQLEASKLLTDLCLEFTGRPRFNHHWGIVEFNLGNSAFVSKDYQAAARHYEAANNAYENVRRISGDDVIYLANHVGALGMHGTCLARLKDFKNAEAKFEKAIELGSRFPAYLPLQKHVIRVLNNYSRMQSEDLHQPELAKATLERNIETCKAIIKRKPDAYLRKSLSFAYGELAFLHIEKGDWEEAAKSSELRLSEMKTAFDQNSLARDFINSYKAALTDFAEISVRVGKLEQAFELAETVKTVVPNSPLYQYHSARAFAKIHQKIKDAMIEDPENEFYGANTLKLAGERALAQLENAIDAGFDKYDDIELNDPAWKSLRQSPDFEIIIELINSK